MTSGNPAVLDPPDRLGTGSPKGFALTPWLRFVGRKIWFHGTAYREAVDNWYRVPACLILPGLAAGIRFWDGERFGPSRGSIWPRLETLVRWNLIQKHLGARIESTVNGPVVHLAFRERDLRFHVRDSATEIAYQLYEVFDEEDYHDLPIEGETVVDIGANVGETALYFLLRRAARVIALEPNPFAFALAEPNLALNGYRGAATLLEVAGSDIDGEIRLAPSVRTNVNRPLESRPDGRPVPTVSLSTLVDRYGLGRAVLKLDCEGAEYRILACPADTLRHFHTIGGEYHYGFGPISRRLEAAGFEVRQTQKAVAFANPYTGTTMYVGGFRARLT